MKKLVFVLICCALLTGCSNSTIKKNETVKEDTTRTSEWTYELTPKNSAYMYNSGIEKLLSYTSTREAFTYMVPKFHSYTQFQEDSTDVYDAYLQIKSNIETGEIEQPDTLNTFTYTFRYLTNEQYLNSGGNWLIQELYKKSDDLNKYDKAEYDSYSDYMNDYKSTIDSVLLENNSICDNVILCGEKTPHNAICYNLSVVVDDTTYTLPCATYYWKLESGNYLSLHITVDNVKYPDLNNPDTYLTLSDKQLVKQLSAYADDYIDLLPLAEKMADYVLVGDFSNYFPKSTNNTSIWDRLGDDVKEEYNKDVSVEFVEEETVNESTVGREEESEDIKYDRGVQGYFDE